jgi:ABC-type phosphate transport system substrate-binding protein
MKARFFVSLIAWVLLAGILAPSANAATEINGTGSSAGTPFASFVPLVLCDQSPTPVHYVNGLWGGFAAGAQHVWVCKRGGADVIFRYHGTRSGDGPNKTKATFGSGGDNQIQLDINNLTGCTGPNNLTFNGRSYQEFTGCTNSVGVNFPTHYGFSDVRGSSFHQSGPPGSFINPIDEGNLVRQTAAVVPFDIVLGTGVVQPTTDGKVAGPVTSLSRLQVEGLLSRTSVSDWRQLGLGTCAPTAGEMCAPGTNLDATSPVTLCLRNSGSGTKASLDEEVMKDATETAIGVALPNTTLASGVFFGNSNGNVRDCIRGAAGFSLAHPNAVGYMETDQAFAAAVTGPNGRPQNLYRVKLNGFTAYDQTKAEPRCDVINGRHLYWSNENMYKRPSPATGIDATTQQLIDDYFATASAASTVALLPAGAFWVADETMNVSKNADAGPVNWKTLPLPTSCQ